MTLPDEVRSENETYKRQAEAVGNAVMKLLQEAVDKERIIHGIYPCAEFLHSSPEDVMLCILQVSNDECHDVTIDIEHTLIQAHCWENGVRVLKVTNSEALQSLLHNMKGRELNRRESKLENSCMLVKYPEVLENMEDWDVIVGYYKSNVQYSCTQTYPLPLPD